MKIKYLRLAPEELSTCQTEAAHVQGWHPSKNCAAIIIRVLSSGDNAPLQTERNCCFPPIEIHTTKSRSVGPSAPAGWCFDPRCSMLQLSLSTSS